MFPDATNRFCTSYGKRDPYTKFARTRSGNILSITGERHQESTKKSSYKPFDIHFATAKTKGRNVYSFRPILHLKKDEVRALLREYGIREHEASALSVVEYGQKPAKIFVLDMSRSYQCSDSQCWSEIGGCYRWILVKHYIIRIGKLFPH
jgi:3'-phosphoadenosine 5'-phosphosulfate sulfotransferase (PAPS reductase)/FAD synthetase